MAAIIVSLGFDGASGWCPSCGESVVVSWDASGRRLKSFPSEADQACLHFQGAYESGVPGTVEFKFRK